MLRSPSARFLYYREQRPGSESGPAPGPVLGLGLGPGSGSGSGLGVETHLINIRIITLRVRARARARARASTSAIAVAKAKAVQDHRRNPIPMTHDLWLVTTTLIITDSGAAVRSQELKRRRLIPVLT